MDGPEVTIQRKLVAFGQNEQIKHLIRSLVCILTSMTGFEASTFFSTCVSDSEPPTAAKYLIAYFALTVFPAPLSPLTMIDWFCSSLQENNRNLNKNLSHKTTPSYVFSTRLENLRSFYRLREITTQSWLLIR